MENSLFDLFREEKKIFDEYKEKNPELLFSPKIPEREIFSWIGIKIDFPYRPKGYLRLYPQDFIVEEISLDEKISEIEPKESEEIPQFSPFTLYANLVKVGISTSEAIFSLARRLNINPNKIGYGGLKDINAITSQKISFPNIDLQLLEEIKKISFPNFFLTDFSFAKGTLTPGQIFGNRFTIFIRTKEKLEEGWVSQKLEKIKKEGFLNFYGPQRFGTPRFLAHRFGKLILQGKYKDAILAFLFQPGLKEIPLIKNCRNEAKSYFPNWEKVEKCFQKFPYTFRQELRLLSYLKHHPKNWVGALVFLKDQTTLWVYAYASYLFNLLLSLEKKINLPSEIPLLLSDEEKDLELYKPWLVRDEIENFIEKIKPFRFLILKKRLVKSKIFPRQIQFKILPEGIILSFILEKGAYATTFLMNLFEIETGEPLPEWVKAQEYDIKKELQIGSVEKIKEILGQNIFKIYKLGETDS
jgi:TruD family tRNA pseudouridine synthase